MKRHDADICPELWDAFALWFRADHLGAGYMLCTEQREEGRWGKYFDVFKAGWDANYEEFREKYEGIDFPNEDD